MPAPSELSDRRECRRGDDEEGKWTREFEENGSQAPVPTKNRGAHSRRKWIVAAAGCLVVAALASTYLYFANVYMPLQVTGDGPDSASGSLFVRTANGEFAQPRTLVYCSTANGRFAAAFFIINTGSFPVTILGADPGPAGPITDHTNTNGFALVDLAGYRAAPQDNSSAPTDPRNVSALAPTTLQPRDELDVWARFQMGSMPLQPSTSIQVQTIWIRYSTFGIQRTAELPLRDEIAVTGDCGR